ncbi:MAG: DUF3800 domain-containing protein [Chloroflexi bacterium]|nr:DUF3800 domain-containing protein [Chloroflexota bacterium]
MMLKTAQRIPFLILGPGSLAPRDRIVHTVCHSDTTLAIIAEDSQAAPALQVADVVAWSIFRKYERQALDFYNLIAPCIVEEVMLTRWKGK